MRIYIDINSCKECPYIEHTRTQGAGYALNYICKKKNMEITTYVKYDSEFPKHIPDWCPFN